MACFTLTIIMIPMMVFGSFVLVSYGQVTANSTTSSNNTRDNASSQPTTIDFSNNPPFIGPSSIYTITGESMLPILRPGDIVGIENHTSFANLKVGDIIVFKSPGVNQGGQHEIIVQRIAEIKTNVQGERVIRTKGDANPNSIRYIDYPIKEENYLGKVLFITEKNFL